MCTRGATTGSASIAMIWIGRPISECSAAWSCGKRWRCLAYCLMDNHVHLLIETPEANLGSGMQWLHGFYAQAYNERHGRVGHVFQGRYGAVRITSDEQLWTVAAYIANNPVEGGLCARPEDWPWSSHAAAILGRPSPDWLDVERLRTMGSDPLSLRDSRGLTPTRGLQETSRPSVRRRP